jgi:hypothetical protein
MKMPVKIERKFIRKIRENCLVFRRSSKDLDSICSFQNLLDTDALGCLYYCGEEGPDSMV